MEFIKHINNKLKGNQSKVLGFYNNLIGGIISGLILVYVLFYYPKMQVVNGMVFILIMILFWYFLGRWIIKHIITNTSLVIEKHLRDYNLNVSAAIIGSLYVTAIAFSLDSPYRNLLLFLYTFVLGLVALLFMYFCVAKNKDGKR